MDIYHNPFYAVFISLFLHISSFDVCLGGVYMWFVCVCGVYMCVYVVCAYMVCAYVVCVCVCSVCMCCSLHLALS